ncbi:MAG TPA: 23S rRNA (uracil(1939)-C(5))-methyltransferase RlmD [Acidobacteriaceae bacterium]|jgi:23S rRNA (uracil1939-C5)-methyltransferase
MAATEQLRIERAVYGGAGLTKTSSGAVAFVPFTLPGEFVEIALPSSSNEAELVQILEASPSRTEPRCPHFGRCGGCQYQHAGYEEQLAMKQAILLETMERAGTQNLPAIAVHSAEPWEYRNRVRFRIANVSGELRIGYSMRGTNEFLGIETCPISSPLLLRAAFSLLETANASREARVWLEDTREAEFFMDDASSKLNMSLYVSARTRQPKGSFGRMCEALQARVPELSGAGAVEAGAAAFRKPAIDTWGAQGLAYRAAGETYWISRGGFFQVNRFLVDALVDLVCSGHKGALAWDLYAGVGLFSRVLARAFTQVTAVEANAAAVTDLRGALAKLGTNHQAVQAPTLAFLQNAVVQRDRPDLVVLDPPRAGAGMEACELLLRLNTPELVYVSCDPTTLARDLAVLQRSYRIKAMHLIDLFPQTFHMETVVMLQQR